MSGVLRMAIANWSEDYVFTSSTAKKLDPTTYNEFVTIKNNLKEASVESSSITGVGKYIDEIEIPAGGYGEFKYKFVREGYDVISIGGVTIPSNYEYLSLVLYYYGTDNKVHAVYKNSHTQALTTYGGASILCRKIL